MLVLSLVHAPGVCVCVCVHSVLIMFALFDMSELCKNRDLIGILIACLIDVAARKIDEGLKCQRFLGPRALSCRKL